MNTDYLDTDLLCMLAIWILKCFNPLMDIGPDPGSHWWSHHRSQRGQAGLQARDRGGKRADHSRGGQDPEGEGHHRPPR